MASSGKKRRPRIVSINPDGQPVPTELLAQGAEARVFISLLDGKECVVKERFAKAYRHPTLDARLSDRRVNLEARMLGRSRRAGIDTPELYGVDSATKRIYMELVQGIPTKLFIRILDQEIASSSSSSSSLLRDDDDDGDDDEPLPSSKLHSALVSLMDGIGKAVATLHNEGIIHGDLTTSNILLRAKKEGFQRSQPLDSQSCLAFFEASLQDVTLIDFGLSFGPAPIEDKAVDLYVLERAFLSTHPKSEELFSKVLQSYERHSRGGPQTLSRLDQVRQRGRKKIAFG